MYRVFESLDELVQSVEGAYGVPMSSNCLVHRTEMLELLDDLRNALPMELDDAQDVLDHRDDVIATAKNEAEQLVGDATAQANETIDQARADSSAMLADAENRANTTVAQAEETADRLVSEARARADEMLTRASAEAERLASKAREAYQRSVDEGLAERERLVSQSSVVQAAEEQARRITEVAHSESNALRVECDQFIDQKLGEFEDMLHGALRIVTRDRTALRSGAGASGAGSQYGRPQGAADYRPAPPVSRSHTASQARYQASESSSRPAYRPERTERSERPERTDRADRGER